MLCGRPIARRSQLPSQSLHSGQGKNEHGRQRLVGRPPSPTLHITSMLAPITRQEGSNNQAKQIAILKTLEKLEELQEGKDNDKRVAIYTDSKITLALLQNKFKRNRLIEPIRNRLIALGHLKWIVHFGWVKGHAGIEGNELVDRLKRSCCGRWTSCV